MPTKPIVEINGKPSDKTCELKKTLDKKGSNWIAKSSENSSRQSFEPKFVLET